jgi:ribonuclease R
MPDLPDEILTLIGKRNYQPIKPRALARRLGVPQSNYRYFRQVLKDLLKSGRLELGKNQVVRPAKPHGTVAGIFRKASAGFGFVRPHPTEALVGQEVFIKAGNVADAATGDEVLVRILKKATRPDRGPEGEILRVLERATHQFVGVYEEEGGEGFVRVDGTTFTEPIYVGDPGAKGARQGDKVVFEMIRFPSPVQRGEGVITEVLGPQGKPGVDTLSVIRAFDLPDAFPEDALDEARRQALAFDESDLNGREDFTQQTIITIDPVDARDFDDAIALTYDSHRRHWNLGVHIADVGYFAQPGGALDREARNRGTSVYLPQRVLPMFPEIISNSLASLQQGRVRYVKSALLEFTQAGQRVHAHFADGAIRVTRRFTYEQVSAIFANPDAHHGQLGDDLLSLVLRMRDFALVLRHRRVKRGALELSMPETDLEFDAEGKVTGAHFVTHDISHQIIEEFMLAANEAVAEQLAELDVAFLRRVHAPPDPRKLKDFAEFVRTLGYEVNVKRATDRFQLQRILEASAARPEMHAVHYALLRSLKQAEYSPAEDGHYALASKDYCHFTSPIRRYPDLTVHRLLGQWLKARRAGSDPAELVALGEHCSFTERRAEKAERELIKIKLLDYLSTRIGMELEIIITGVHEYGFFGQAAELPIEGLVHVSTLLDDSYHFDGATHSLVGRRTKRRFRLGDRVRVRVARVDKQRRELDFQVKDQRRGKSGR